MANNPILASDAGGADPITGGDLTADGPTQSDSPGGSSEDSPGSEESYPVSQGAFGDYWSVPILVDAPRRNKRLEPMEEDIYGFSFKMGPEADTRTIDRVYHNGKWYLPDDYDQLLQEFVLNYFTPGFDPSELGFPTDMSMNTYSMDFWSRFFELGRKTWGKDDFGPHGEWNPFAKYGIEGNSYDLAVFLEGAYGIVKLSRFAMLNWLSKEPDTWKVFYTVQSESDALRLMSGGEPWPTSPTSAHLGEGRYAWGARSDAEAYLVLKEQRGIPGLRIVEARIPEGQYNSLNTLDLRNCDVGYVDNWLSSHSSLFGEGLPHNFDHVVRETGNFGPEFFFSKKNIYIILCKMKATSKFVRVKNGRASFAVVGVEVIPQADDLVVWGEEVSMFSKFYNAAVLEGISEALSWHIQCGGERKSFRIINFVESLADTRPDAVKCATVSAAWIALGHEENQLLFEFINDEWRAQVSN